ncbi:T9SS type A sorting domain-containing protein [Winogradskyella psychrotolerans]|uniref:T9SS type A sorting domain-containing protein n=1 Tax=Winogradskyella psychrotolerans TaxID=1344585 RepID=UPI001C065131|nr:T9SS type A sorting domain-containing protein [Winogradskyella psychrotolerans]MBU2929972.1 T9SS type A sorting domain-containing protein [Winogradskyella psychrotolerans]
MNTKAKIYTVLSLLLSTYGFSQTGPGGVTTDNEIWLKAENSTFTDAGVTPASNNSSIQQWNDASGEGNNASQGNGGLQPKLKTDAINGYSALNFDGNNDGIFSTGVGHSNEVSLFVVLQAPSFDSNTRGIIQAGPSGTAFSTDANQKTIGMWATNGYLWGRGVQSDGVKKSFPNGAGIKLYADTPYVLTQDFKGTSITQYINAEASQTISYDGTLNSFVDFGIGRQSTSSFNGNIAEVILYTKSLNLSETTIVENYLSAKYGTALDGSKDFYTQDDAVNGDFDHNVAGIGQASDGSNHLASRGTGILSMHTPSALSNGDFLFWGEDTKDPAYDFAFNSNNNSQELTSKWRVSKTGDLGTVTLEFDLSTITAAADGCEGLQLVVDDNNTFGSATAYDLTVVGTTATVTGVSFTDGDYFTLSFISDIVWDGTDYLKGLAVSDAPDTGDACYRFLVKSGTDAVLSANATVESVMVEAGGSLTIDSGVTLTVTEAVNLTSVSDSYSSLILNGTISGTINYERHVNMLGTASGAGNDLIAAPLSGLSFDTFIALGSPTNASKLATNGTHYAFGPYNNASGTTAYEIFEVAATTALESGKGYRAATTTSDQVLTFTGNVVTGNVSAPISSPVGGSQWNLVGNPYPSYLSASEFLTANTAALDDDAEAIYAYNSGTYTGSEATTGNFTIINAATTETLNIAPGQGFLVAAKNATGNVVFNNGSSSTTDMRTLIGSDDYIVGRSPSISYNLKLDLVGSNTYRTSFYFNEGSSLGLDPGYDAKVFGAAPTFALYSQLVESNENVNFALQSLNTSNISDVTIPLGVNANQGEQISFTISQSTLPNTVEVYLEDTVNNTTTLLNSGDYVLTPNANLDGIGRFYLRLSNSTLSTTINTLDALTIYTNTADKTIVVAGQLADATKATIYDLQGRIVISKNLITSSRSQAIDVSGLSTGVYVVELNNNTQNKTQKVILK